MHETMQHFEGTTKKVISCCQRDQKMIKKIPYEGLKPYCIQGQEKHSNVQNKHKTLKDILKT